MSRSPTSSRRYRVYTSHTLRRREQALAEHRTTVEALRAIGVEQAAVTGSA